MAILSGLSIRARWYNHDDLRSGRAEALLPDAHCSLLHILFPPFTTHHWHFTFVCSRPIETNTSSTTFVHLYYHHGTLFSQRHHPSQQFTPAPAAVWQVQRTLRVQLSGFSKQRYRGRGTRQRRNRRRGRYECSTGIRCLTLT